MLFNSYELIFAFLPIAVTGYYALARRTATAARKWLVACSVLYYGWWHAPYVLLLAGSVVGNYGMGRLVRACAGRGAQRWALGCGVALNLLVLAVFKYANFVVDNFNAVSGAHFVLRDIVLPIGVSFFTFQQIAYLVDVSRGCVAGYRFLDYCLFVSFFPQFIAGPIVHHSEVMPQFARLDRDDRGRRLAVGPTVFVIGLFKKVVVANTVAVFATAVFDDAAVARTMTFAEAWLATTAYSFQIYFDFSGYSDMAIGIGCLFGIRLPLNFASPYKARNIVEFWQRWHMTLSRFLRDYLYIPLGGNRKGARRRYVNLMLTMLLGGLWHGAGWNFIVWGGAHGMLLMVTHAWQAWRRARSAPRAGGPALRAASVACTSLAVALAWVLFRAPGLGAASEVIRALCGMNGLTLATTIGARKDTVILPCL